MDINKNINGYLVISDIIGGQSVIRRYMGFTKAEAIGRFKRLAKRIKQDY